MGFVRLAHVRCYKHLVTTALRLTLSPLINHPPQTSSIRNILCSILVQTFIWRRSYWISGRSIMRYLFSFYADAARIALQSILAHKLRAFLTLLGIIIGVASVVVVCVLGSDIKDKFFPNIDPIGQNLKVRGMPMRVVGVEDKRGAFFGDSLDRHIYIPATTHLQIFGRNGLQIHGKAGTRENFQPVIEDARLTMRNKHR